jgi:hypothetical protein
MAALVSTCYDHFTKQQLTPSQRKKHWHPGLLLLDTICILHGP